jgi:hypothetical protein
MTACLPVESTGVSYALYLTAMISEPLPTTVSGGNYILTLWIVSEYNDVPSIPYLLFFPLAFGIIYRLGCDSSNDCHSFHAHLGFAFSLWIRYVFLRRIDERMQLITSL